MPIVDDTSHPWRDTRTMNVAPIKPDPRDARIAELEAQLSSSTTGDRRDQHDGIGAMREEIGRLRARLDRVEGVLGVFANRAHYPDDFWLGDPREHPADFARRALSGE